MSSSGINCCFEKFINIAEVQIQFCFSSHLQLFIVSRRDNGFEHALIDFGVDLASFEFIDFGQL